MPFVHLSEIRNPMVIAKFVHQNIGVSVSSQTFLEQYDTVLSQRLVQQYRCSTSEASQLKLELVRQLQKEEVRLTIAEHWAIADAFIKEKTPAIWQAMQQNFGLSQAGFQVLLQALRSGNDDLFEQVFLRHFKDCVRFLKQQYEAKQEDAYDATMDAMLYFCQRLTEGKIKYGNLRFLFTQIARQIYVRAMKKGSKQVLTETFELPEPEKQYDQEVYTCLEKALKLLCQDCRQLLTDNYHNNLKLNEIADLAKKSPAAIRKQKQRCLGKLRQYFIQFYQP
jgi:RNA polymerase sigma factor (sigma-70 family)